MNATQTPEQWRPVIGYEGRYEVSDHGRVRSLERVIETRRGPRAVRGRLLKPRRDPRGYLRISPGFGKDASIHVLVMEAFVGPRPEGRVICHNDGQPGNNHVSNLRYDTQQNNCLDTIKHGRSRQKERTHCPNGHVYDEQNTHYRKHGRRTCRACDRRRSRTRMRPTIRIDRDAGASYIQLSAAPITETRELVGSKSSVLLDYGADGLLVGIETLFAPDVL